MYLKASRSDFLRDWNWILFTLLQIDMFQLKHYLPNDIIPRVSIEAQDNEMKSQGLK